MIHGWDIELPPVARNTDRETSHAAAKSVTSQTITLTRRAILVALDDGVPATDEQIIDAVAWAFKTSSRPGTPSESGIRTRRKELENLGLVRVAGESRTSSNRKCMTFTITEEGRAELARG